MQSAPTREVFARSVPRSVALLLLVCTLITLARFVSDPLRQVLGETREWITDYCCYTDAGHRFLDDPHRLYEPTGQGLMQTSIGTIDGFVYPPPAILVFAPFAALSLPLGFALFSLFVIGALLWSVHLLLRSDLWDGVASTGVERWLPYLAALAFGPTVMNLKGGQFNTIVLFVCCAALYALRRERPILAGVLVALGVWLKLYPGVLVLLVFVIESRMRWRYLGSVVLGGLGIPLLALPFIPFDLYRVFAVDVMPILSAVTNLATINQSLYGAAMRLGSDPVFWGERPYVAITPMLRLLVTLFGVGAMLGAVLQLRGAGRDRMLVAGVVLLALTPVISSFGWEAAYTMGIPLFLLLLSRLPTLHGARRVLGWTAFIIFLIPHPTGVLESTVNALPLWMQHIVYSRYIWVTLLAVWLVLFAFDRDKSGERTASAV